MFLLCSQTEYLGHVIDTEELHPTAEKVRAIQEARKPQNVSELRSFFDIINYYNRFLPNLLTILAPSPKWMCGQEQDEAFSAAKEALQDDLLLVHYDESKPLILACDASQYGLGAVLSHTMKDGTERPVAYASRTLNLLRTGILNSRRRDWLLSLEQRNFITTSVVDFFQLNLTTNPWLTFSMKLREFPQWHHRVFSDVL